MKFAFWPRMRPALPALVLALLAIGLFFHAEIVAAVHVWNSSTAYGHCWLVVPIAAYIGYDRRHQAAAAGLHPRPGLWLLGLPLMLLWLAANLLGIMEARQLVLIAFVQLVLLAVCGPRLWRALAGAFLYLFFLVPFGAFLTPALQHFTTSFIARGLGLFGIPHTASANRIQIPEGLFYVAEACAGLRFLIASVAFGVLYALVMFRSAGRRAMFIAASCVVPVIANGLRALGIVVLGHLMGSAEAAAADHLVYGWIFFSLVVVALAGAGWPFRQDAAPVPAPLPAGPGDMTGRAILAVLPVLMVAGLGTGLAHVFMASDSVAVVALRGFLAAQGHWLKQL
jgi:exosortase A